MCIPHDDFSLVYSLEESESGATDPNSAVPAAKAQRGFMKALTATVSGLA